MKSFTLKFALTFLLGVGLASAAVAQKIGGTVKDSAGKPVVGASVIVEGSTLGASSGVDGQWSLNVPDASKKTLVISYIGMKTQRIAIGSKTRIDVTLEDESTALDDVVVVGYATVKRRDVVGSVASVNAETLQQMPVASVAEAMTGRMAGVQITATEGDPDAEIRIRVRGAGTFSSDGAPLYIVDGFPVESISDVSSSEIQSIDILKDAFSTAIYGSRGANGVVLITTKSGEKGKVNVNYNVYWGFKDIARKNQVQDAQPFGVRQMTVQTGRHPEQGGGQLRALFRGVFRHRPLRQREGQQLDGAALRPHGRAVQPQPFTVSGGGDKFKWNATYACLYDKAIMVGSNCNSGDRSSASKHRSTPTSASRSISTSAIRV
ncbi:MAG: carboxypeptidase-like regulatory domain-containing protein [Alistipes senegalensis]